MRQFCQHEHAWQRHPQGLTRRDFGRLAALLTAGAALPFSNEATLAQDLKAFANLPPGSWGPRSSRFPSARILPTTPRL